MLINERLKHSQYKVQPEKVINIPIGVPNQCHANTFEYQKLDVLKTGCKQSMPVSGWLVGEYDKHNDSVEIVQHWWNMDTVTFQHYDTTPRYFDRMKYEC